MRYTWENDILACICQAMQTLEFEIYSFMKLFILSGFMIIFQTHNTHNVYAHVPYINAMGNVSNINKVAVHIRR